MTERRDRPEHERRDAVGEQLAKGKRNSKNGFLPIPWLFAVVLVGTSALLSGAVTSYFHERGRADQADQAASSRLERYQERTEQHYDEHRREVAELRIKAAELRADLDHLKANAQEALAGLKASVKVCRDDIELLHRRMLLRESRP